MIRHISCYVDQHCATKLVYVLLTIYNWIWHDVFLPLSWVRMVKGPINQPGIACVQCKQQACCLIKVRILIVHACSFTFFANASIEDCNVQHTKLLHVPIKHLLLLLFISHITLDCLSLTLCMLQLVYLQ